MPYPAWPVEMLGSRTMKDSLIYKICPREEWMAACDAGSYAGSADDLRDGFIHFSTAAQVPGTLERHFAGRENLVIACFAAESLGSGLRFEASRRGELFPHLYGRLDPALALKVHALNRDVEGRFILPPLA